MHTSQARRSFVTTYLSIIIFDSNDTNSIQSLCKTVCVALVGMSAARARTHTCARTHTHARAHAHPHAHTHTHTHTRAHAHAHARADQIIIYAATPLNEPHQCILTQFNNCNFSKAQIVLSLMIVLYTATCRSFLMSILMQI